MLMLTTTWWLAIAFLVAFPRLTRAESKAVRGSQERRDVLSAEEPPLQLTENAGWFISSSSASDLVVETKVDRVTPAAFGKNPKEKDTVDQDHRGLFLVGTFNPNDGYIWFSNPPTYSCLETCAGLFGGTTSNYQCSTMNSIIDNQAWLAVFGEDGCLIFPENYKLNTFYNCGVKDCAASAYASDKCIAFNNCFYSECEYASYHIWNAGTDREVVRLTDGWTGCVQEPYNIEVRPCASTTSMVTLKVSKTVGGVIHRQKEYVEPYYLWGDKNGNVYPNPSPLPNGSYKLTTVIDGVQKTITFTQNC